MYKIWRTPASRFNGAPAGLPGSDLQDETITADSAYTDKALEEIAGAGFNAIWVHGVLHHLAQVAPFPELGGNAAMHQAALQRLIARAKTHGIKVFIYLQPPRALPTTFTAFWERHSDVGGQEETEQESDAEAVVYRSLCVSDLQVTEWLEAAAADVAQHLPGLGGFIVITASEHPSHCYSRRMKRDPLPWLEVIECPRCAKREPEEVVIDILSALHRGIRTISSEVELIAWNWSWFWSPQSYTKVIELFPDALAKDAILLLDFERGGRMDIPGHRGHLYDEYSLAYSGPSERFMESYHTAIQRQMRVMAKLQIGTTHELATVVNLPVIGNLYDKARFIRNHGLAGIMGCWNFGTFQSTNTLGFNYFLSAPIEDDRAAALEAFARHRFPGASASLMRKAWEQFQNAMLYYPFCIPFLYHGVHSHTLSYYQVYAKGPLTGVSAGKGWMPDVRGDDLSNSYQLNNPPFSLDEIIVRLEKLAQAWSIGVDLMRSALEEAKEREAAALELGNAAICAAVWYSAWNSYRVYRLRKNWSADNTVLLDVIAREEIAVLRNVLPYVIADARQGIHLEPHARMFDAASIRQKVTILESLLEEA